MKIIWRYNFFKSHFLGTTVLLYNEYLNTLIIINYLQPQIYSFFLWTMFLSPIHFPYLFHDKVEIERLKS